MSGYCWTLSAEIGTFFATIMKGKNIRRLEKSESSTHGILRRNKSGEADFISLMMIPPDLFAKLFYSTMNQLCRIGKIIIHDEQCLVEYTGLLIDIFDLLIQMRSTNHQWFLQNSLKLLLFSIVFCAF